MLCLRKNIKLVTFISFPLSIFLFVAAKPIILFLFTEKWGESIIYFQLLCISGMFMPINIANRDMFASIGKSRLFFISQLVYKILGVLLMIIGIYCWGILGLLYGKIVADFSLFFINSSISNRLIGYGIFTQLKDVSSNFVTSLFAGTGLHFFLATFSIEPIFQLICGFLIFCMIYILLSAVISKEQYDFCIQNMRKKLMKQWN